MEVRDIFALRRDKRYEEAYQAIVHLYAYHQGPHTNLCMFWCTHDLFRLRLQQKRMDEARRLLYQMVKIYPQTNDRVGMGNRAIINAALALDKQVENFNLLYFMPYFNRMTEADWKPYVAQGHPVPSLGQQVVNHLLKDLQHRDASYIDRIADLFRTAFQKAPYYKENLRHLAQMHALAGHTNQAIATYKRLLLRHHDSYLYAELAKLVPDDKEKIALACMAVTQQKREEYAAKYHLELARLLLRDHPRRAAYELERYGELRERHHQQVSAYAQRMRLSLQGTRPVTSEEQQELYLRAKAVVERLLRQ